MKKDSFGDRMKGYENAYRIKLPKRMPVIIRIDGKAFHTYTRGMKKPFDRDLTQAMWETSKYIAENVMGCKLVYHQSDEISLLLTNYDKLTSDAWFDNNLQKIVSVAASLATAKFNEIMRKTYPEKQLALFDARAYVLPKEEVCNYFLWRQQDATKNSVSMVAQSLFPHKRLQGLNGLKMKELMIKEHGVNWDTLETWKKRGACIVKSKTLVENVVRQDWKVDSEIPVFSDDRSYVESQVYIESE